MATVGKLKSGFGPLKNFLMSFYVHARAPENFAFFLCVFFFLKLFREDKIQKGNQAKQEWGWGEGSADA